MARRVARLQKTPGPNGTGRPSLPESSSSTYIKSVLKQRMYTVSLFEACVWGDQPVPPCVGGRGENSGSECDARPPGLGSEAAKSRLRCRKDFGGWVSFFLTPVLSSFRSYIFGPIGLLFPRPKLN